MAENEVVYRQHNEHIQWRLRELKRVAKEDHQESMLAELDAPLQFHCECSDEHCTQRVLIKPNRHAEIHKARNRFVVVCDHVNPNIEHVIAKEADYCIIEKYAEPPAKASGLRHTRNH